MNKPFKPTAVLGDQYDRYKGRDVIPLKGGQKRPRDNGWQRQCYDGAKVIEKAKAGNSNMGLRLGADDLVIDYDPRNDKTGDSLVRLARDFGLDLSTLPNVATGGGGDHFMMKMTPGPKLTTTLAAYPGVEFKSKGTQIVCAGSIHPTTGRHYLWNDFPNVPLEDAPQAPPSLVQAITRPLHDFKSSGGGEHSPEQCAAMLDVLDPKDFSKNDEWFPIMCAVHHASGGDAREDFISWCISDPAFANQADEIGVRWDSLHREKPGAITVQTLYKALRDAGHADTISQPTAKDDFADAPEILPTPEEKKADDRRKERFKAQSLSELLAIPDPKWLVEDVLTENALFEIFGSFKAGKTFYGMEMGLAIATGLDFFGSKTTQGPVLYIIAEGNRKLFGYRVNEWVNAREKDKAKRELLRAMVEANFKVVGFPVHFDVAADLEAFVVANPGKWKAVFVDTLMRNMRGDPMKPNDLIAFMAGCDHLRALPCAPAVVFLHHMRREGGVGGYGPIIGEAFADGTACVTKNSKAERVFQLKDMRDSPDDVLPWVCTIEKVRVVMSLEKSRTVGVLTFVRRGEDDPDKRVLVTLYTEQPNTIAALVGNAKVSERTAYRILKKLRADELLEADTLALTASGKAIAKTAIQEGMEWQ